MKANLSAGRLEIPTWTSDVVYLLQHCMKPVGSICGEHICSWNEHGRREHLVFLLVGSLLRVVICFERFASSNFRMPRA